MIKRKEIWKDIKNYEEQYQVSNLGRVKSKERIVLRNNKYKIHLKEKILYQGERKTKTEEWKKHHEKMNKMSTVL